MKQVLAYSLVILLFSACGSKDAADETGKKMYDNIRLNEAQYAAAGLEAGTPQMHRFSGTHRMNGSVDVPPQNMVSVSFPFGGYLQNTDLLPGMHVKKGQVLALLQDASYVQTQQDFLLSKIRLEQMEKELERQQSLASQKATTDKALLQAKTDCHLARIEVKALAEKLLLMGIDPENFTEEKLTRTVKVLSPINGFVTHVNVNIGKYVNPTDVLFELVNPDDIHLALTAFEKDLPLLKEGQRVRCSTLEHPDNIYNAEIILISRNIDRDRTASVHCHFEKYDPSLLPGMFMTAEVFDEEVALPALPASSVVSYEGKNYVFAITGNRSYAMQEVTVAATDSAFVSVRLVSGNQPLQGRYVTRNAYNLLMAIKNEPGEE
jgi:cobalt-zinc-cadmium efflux system membrane fusion protein